MKRHCLTLDLKPDKALIKAYEEWHTKVWLKIMDSIKPAGIENMEIYRVSNRLSMITEANESFSFDGKTKADLANDKVQEWETLMSQFQQSLTFAQPG